MSVEVRTAGGIAEVVIDFPPVNAVPVQGWYDLASAVTAAGAEASTRAVILAAAGRGFCAGVDIKEMQRIPGHEALLGANRGCTAAFGAVYDCPVPVIAAVHGFCLGGGDRGQGPGGDPAGQAVAERHRPGRREAVLPVRAGVHLRAEPGRRRGPGPAGVRRQQASGREAGVTPDEIVAELRDGMTIGIGGWGSRRKPMALVRAILRSPLRDLTVVSYTGPDVGLLIASGQARRIVTGFASLDSIPLEPNFRRARQDGTVELTELDEGMLHWGLLAAAHRLPFLPIRAGLGSGVLEVNPELRTVRSPYADPFGLGEELVAVPALRLDAALVHMNRADAAGNGQYLGPDPYFDDLFCLAAARAYVSCEQIVPALTGPPQSLLLNRAMVHGVTETPNGAHFTSCVPDYGRDEGFQRRYATAAADPDDWRRFRAEYLDGDEAAYQKAVKR